MSLHYYARYFPPLYKKEKNKIVNVFDNIRDKALSLFDNTGWIKWIHEGTSPAYTQTDKEMSLVYGAISSHCAKCLNLNGCCFPRNNMPDHPLHFNCHCRLMPVNNIRFQANCDTRKFEEYAFIHRKYDDKKGLFESLGYDKIDSQTLLNEYCRQAREKYAKGDFTLIETGKFGQIININITLPNKNSKEMSSLVSGWMVYPDGKIQLATVFVRWAK